MNSFAFPRTARLSARSNALALAFSRSIARRMRPRLFMITSDGSTLIKAQELDRLPAHLIMPGGGCGGAQPCPLCIAPGTGRLAETRPLLDRNTPDDSDTAAAIWSKHNGLPISDADAPVGKRSRQIRLM